MSYLIKINEERETKSIVKNINDVAYKKLEKLSLFLDIKFADNLKEKKNRINSKYLELVICKIMYDV
jgi:hypothetical protein